MSSLTHVVSFILLTIYCANSVSSLLNSLFSEIADVTLSEDGKLNFTQLATKYGHCADQHEITTEDKYILTMFRLGDRYGPSVLLLPGLYDHADTFIVRGNTSLAITLADAGYNVWVGNSRGNKFGRRHVTLNPDTDEEFWEFTFHEIGYYDLAAMIDYVCEKTGEESITTMGFSQGTTAHYVLTSTRPEYNDKIKLTISLAPVAFQNNLSPSYSRMASAYPAIDLLLKTFGYNEILQDHTAATTLMRFICSKGIVSQVVCNYGALIPYPGTDAFHVEPDFLNTLYGHYPAGTSRKAMEHFNQLFMRKSFVQYDYGTVINLAKYGSTDPPEYDLSAVTAKMALIAGKNDQYARVKDVEHLRDCLPNVVHYEVLEPELWGHSDFLWSQGLTTYLYPSIFKILKEHVRSDKTIAK